MTEKNNKSPKITVDGIININNNIVLVKRKYEPYKDYWAFPGGFVNYGETVEEAVIREILEETNLKTKIVNLLGVYSNPNRDPRGHTISIVYVLEPVNNSNNIIPKGGDDAKEAKLFNISEIPNINLAFDHKQIYYDYLEYLEKENK